MLILIDKRFLVPRAYCLQYNDTGGFCGVVNCPYKHILYEHQKSDGDTTSRAVVPYGDSSGNPLFVKIKRIEIER